MQALVGDRGGQAERVGLEGVQRVYVPFDQIIERRRITSQSSPIHESASARISGSRRWSRWPDQVEAVARVLARDDVPPGIAQRSPKMRWATPARPRWKAAD